MRVLWMSPHVRGSPVRPSRPMPDCSHVSLDHGCARTQSSIAPRSGPSGHSPLTELKVEPGHAGSSLSIGYFETWTGRRSIGRDTVGGTPA